MTDHPAPRPCGSCPYQRDVPAGIWHPEEYAKLPEYDRETWEQPPGVFMCHQRDGSLCAGWVGCHDTDQLLAVRLASMQGRVDAEELASYTTDVPLFGSGAEAARHGLSGVARPEAPAVRVMAGIQRKRARHGRTAQQ